MRGALLSVGVALATVGALAPPSGVVRACSCAENPVAFELERETATAVVAGSQLEYADLSPDEHTIDRRWLFRVDDRYRGDTPDVIEVRVEAEQGACDDVVTRLPSVLLLGDPEPDGWYRYPTCRDLYRTVDLAPFFDDVWSIDGRGPPTVISAVRTATHNLVVLDDVGDVLGYLPGTGETWGLSMCPGAATMLQLRVADAAELVVWDLSTWSAISSMSLPQIDTSEIERPIPLTCITSDAASAFVAWRSGLDVDLTTSAVTERSENEYGVTAVGHDATLSIGPSDESWVVRADGRQDPVFTGPRAVDVFLVSSTSISGDGWNVASMYNVGVERTELRTEQVGPDGAQPVLSLDLDVAVYPFTAVTLDGAVAAALPRLPSFVPEPLYSRSGAGVPRPAPTLPEGERSATAATADNDSGDGGDGGPVVAVIGPKTDPVEGGAPSDGDGSATAIVLVLIGAVAAVVAWGLVRRRPRSVG